MRHRLILGEEVLRLAAGSNRPHPNGRPVTHEQVGALIMLVNERCNSLEGTLFNCPLRLRHFLHHATWIVGVSYEESTSFNVVG